jgi:hypothetical protein
MKTARLQWLFLFLILNVTVGLSAQQSDADRKLLADEIWICGASGP